MLIKWRVTVVVPALVILAGCSGGGRGAGGPFGGHAPTSASPSPTDSPAGADRFTFADTLQNGDADAIRSALGCSGDAGTVENLQLQVGAYTPALELSCYLPGAQAPVFLLRYDAAHSGAVLPTTWAQDAADHFGTENGVDGTGAQVTYHAEALQGLPIMAISDDPDQLQAVDDVVAQHPS